MPRELIRSVDQLRTWIDEIPTRHHQVGDSCSCGWSPIFVRGLRPTTWADHASGGPIHDIGDSLPSRTSNDDGPISMAQLEDDLYACIDGLHEVVDILLDTLERVALGKAGAPEAAAIICKAYPQSSWAWRIREAVDVDLSLADHIRGTY